MIRQLWGPFVDLVGTGGYAAWTLGTWFTMKFSNILMYLVIAVVFVGAMLINVPQRKAGSE